MADACVFSTMQVRSVLEVTTFLRRQLTEYPGPVATRPGVRLSCALCALGGAMAS